MFIIGVRLDTNARRLTSEIDLQKRPQSDDSVPGELCNMAVFNERETELSGLQRALVLGRRAGAGGVRAAALLAIGRFRAEAASATQT